MLLEIAYIFLLGGLLAFGARKIHLPGLFGMLVAGIILGRGGFNLLHEFTPVAPMLRQCALVIILWRAGMSLQLDTLKKIGVNAFLMSCVPAACEIAAIVVIAPPLLKINYTEALMLGAILAAVSPAVIVPRMLHLQSEGYGKHKSIPQLITAGASMDDIFVIVIFSSALTLSVGGEFSYREVLNVPISIISGVAVGVINGLLLALYFKKFNINTTMKVLIMLSISFLLLALEKNSPVPFSGLLAIMASGIILLRQLPDRVTHITHQFSKLWIPSEIILFVSIGAELDLATAWNSSSAILVLLAGSLLLRGVGVVLALIGSRLKYKEKLFCILAYLPKATVQAAIGAIPLSMGLPCGQTLLAAAVAAILITAPLGAFAIDMTHQKLLSEDI